LNEADDFDRALVAAVRPPTWTNPTPTGRYNLVVIGGGTAGLVSAVGAASLGARVALVERHWLGGDCLNYGCVPSKALLRAARAAYDVRTAAELGIEVGEPRVDFPAVMQRMRRLRAQIAPHDSAERLAGLGIDVYFGAATFVARDAIEVAGARLPFARAIIATGARAALPPVPDLAALTPLTNETVFSLTELPRRLLVLGGGPIGCELAQAFCRFGSEVTILDRDDRVLPREDRDASAIVQAQLEREGVRLVLGAHLIAATRDGDTRTLSFTRAGVTEHAHGEQLLVAAGRTPNLDGLGLEAAGIAGTERGIQIDDRLRTTNRRVFAVGDVASRFQFTHAADALARIAIQNALFFGRKRASALVMPWCTYTDPEVAHVGLDEHEAKERSLTTLTVQLEVNDRAILDGETRGFARAHVASDGTLRGATFVARHAGEAIGEASLAITTRQKLGVLSATIHPYPTQAEVWKRLGDAYNARRLTPRIRKLFGWLLRRRR
jgi:pyruvate/2-oxoglutarate dehydrogenase complex dihydrolipoamide dehydrogenase (E3) component